MWPSPENKFLIRNHTVCWWCFIISDRNFGAFSAVPNLVHYHMIKWFAANNLVLNLDEIDVIKFAMNNSLQCLLNWLQREVCRRNHKCKISWSANWLPPTLEESYRSNWVSVPYRQHWPKSIYFTYFCSIIKHGIIIWGNSSNSGNIFTLQRKLLELWLVHNLDHVEVCLKKLRIYLLYASLYCH